MSSLHVGGSAARRAQPRDGSSSPRGTKNKTSRAAVAAADLELADKEAAGGAGAGGAGGKARGGSPSRRMTARQRGYSKKLTKRQLSKISSTWQDQLQEELADDAKVDAEVGQQSCCDRAFVYAQAVLLPESSFVLRWEIVVSIAVMWTAAILPLEISVFSNNLALGTTMSPFYAFLKAMSYIVTAVFLADIFIEGKTAYLDPMTSKLVTEPGKVLRHYLFNPLGFPFDFLTSFPFTELFEGLLTNRSYAATLRAVNALKLLRLIRIVRLLRYMDRYVKIDKASLSTIKIITVFILVIHWTGCVWFLVAMDDPYPCSPGEGESSKMCIAFRSDSWVVAGSYETIGSDMDYILIVWYWATTTITSVGYGDISPVNTVEWALTIFIEIIGSLFAAVRFTCGSRVEEWRVWWSR